MNILHILSQTQLTGAESHVVTLSKEQILLNNKVYIVSDKWHSEKTCEIFNLEISTRSLFTKLKNILFLIKFVKEKNIEVIHCHSRAAVKHGFWISKLTNACLVTTFHGRHHSSFSKRVFNSYGEMQIAICENIKTAHTKELKVSETAIHVIENPVVSSEKNKTINVSPSSSRKKLAIIGRSSGPKGEKIQQIIINCAEFWLTEFPDLEIHVIAPQPENFKPRFQQKVQQLSDQFNSRLKVLGHIENLASQLNNYTAVIASGRIAIECLVTQVTCFACGEYDYHGQISLQNFEDCLMSNFGDIGHEATREKPLINSKIQKDIFDFFSTEKSTSNSLAINKENLSYLAIERFNTDKIAKQINEVYKIARFKRFYPKNIPILMYHKIPNESLKSKHQIFVTKKEFEKHLQFFNFLGFTSIHFSDLKQMIDNGLTSKDFNSKFLIITFDDGYTDNLTNAQDLLIKYNHKAVIYLLSNTQISQNTWDTNNDSSETVSTLMTDKERKQLNLEIFEIGSHGVDHSDFTKLNEQEITSQMKDSKKSLEIEFKTSVISMAYPFGRTNKTIEHLAKKSGYDFAVNTDSGGFHIADSLHSMFRVNIFPKENIFSLWKKTSSWYRIRFFRKYNK